MKTEQTNNAEKDVTAATISEAGPANSDQNSQQELIKKHRLSTGVMMAPEAEAEPETKIEAEPETKIEAEPEAAFAAPETNKRRVGGAFFASVAGFTTGVQVTNQLAKTWYLINGLRPSPFVANNFVPLSLNLLFTTKLGSACEPTRMDYLFLRNVSRFGTRLISKYGRSSTNNRGR